MNANKTIPLLQKVLDQNNKNLTDTWLSVLKTHIQVSAVTGGEDFSAAAEFESADILPQMMFHGLWH